MRVAPVSRHDRRRADDRSAPRSTLDTLESESIHIIREVVAEFERPVLLFSGGKDSVVVLHLAAKAFWPARVPFPVLHVDTGHNFPEVIDFRDRTVERLGLRLEVADGAATTSTTAACRSAPTAPATRCRPNRCSTRSPQAGTTPCSAAPAATRTRRVRRSGS